MKTECIAPGSGTRVRITYRSERDCHLGTVTSMKSKFGPRFLVIRMDDGSLICVNCRHLIAAL